MPTRLYFPLDTLPAISPAVAGGWTYTSEFVRRKLASTKGSSAITVGTQVGPWTPGNFAIDRQYISAPIVAGAVFTSGSSSITLQLMVREYANNDNVNNLYITVRILNNDGTTVRATIKALGTYNTAAEFINNATHRNQTGLAAGNTLLTGSYTTVAGDRLCIEIGYCDSGGGGNTPEASAKWGENATDLPVNNTQTSNGAGWIEFSTNMTFAGDTTTLIADSTTYLQTGIAATLRYARTLNAAQGSITTAGLGTAFRILKKLLAAASTFAVTGTTAVLKKRIYLAAANAAFTLVGRDALMNNVKRLLANVAAYLLDGKNTTIIPPTPTGNTPIDDEQLKIISQYIANAAPPFYSIVQSFVNDLYSTGCRPMELLERSRWTQSIIDPLYWTMQPQKGNFTREILKSSLSDSLNYSIIMNVDPYESLSLRQLEYSINAVNPVGRLYADTKPIIAYMYRYNRVRQMLLDGYTQLQISAAFGWVAPTISASYSTKQVSIYFPAIPGQTYYITDPNHNTVTDSNGDKIIST